MGRSGIVGEDVVAVVLVLVFCIASLGFTPPSSSSSFTFTSSPSNPYLRTPENGVDQAAAAAAASAIPSSRVIHFPRYRASFPVESQLSTLKPDLASTWCLMVLNSSRVIVSPSSSESVSESELGGEEEEDGRRNRRLAASDEEVKKERLFQSNELRV